MPGQCLLPFHGGNMHQRAIRHMLTMCGWIRGGRLCGGRYSAAVCSTVAFERLHACAQATVPGEQRTLAI